MKKITVEFYNSQSQVVNDSIDRIITEVYNYYRKYQKKCIMLTGCGPSNGTTTVAYNLAVGLSMAGWKTLLVDADLRKNKIFKRTNYNGQAGLGSLLEGEDTFDSIVMETNYKNLDFVSSGISKYSPVRLFCSEKMEDFLMEAKANYDFVIIDTPSINVVPDGSILFPAVDGITLVAELNKTTKKQLLNAKRMVQREADKYYGVIINKVDMKQYSKHIKDYDYFNKKKLVYRHKHVVKKAKKRRQENGGISNV